MVLWCRVCGSLMGVHEPYCDRRADRNGLCLTCAVKEKVLDLEGAASNPAKPVGDATLTAHLTGPHMRSENIGAALNVDPD